MVLGDVFHSSPIKVSMPTNEGLCRSGASAQCVSTLFAGPTPLSFSAGKDAYQQWQASAVTNQQSDVIVVGANDGMVHVFKADCWVNGSDPNSVIQTSSYMSALTGIGGEVNCSSTGQKPGDELFAFIPPDMLPKLKYLVGSIHYPFVDGNPMVRDIWVNGVQTDNTVNAASRTATKQPGQYRTVAIIGERSGGTHYFALDLTNPLAFSESRGSAAGFTTTSGASRFLWMYPSVGSTQELAFGQTWNDYLPDPPPIGPIRLKTTDAVGQGAVSYGSGLRFREDWVAFLTGGYDPTGIRGRGMFMVDAWTGKELFEASESPVPSNGTAVTQAVSAMQYPFPAMASVLNWGTSAIQAQVPDNVDFFDTATGGDLGGQLWTLRFYDPDPNNWAVGRAFQESLDDGTTEYNRYPIFNMPQNVKTPGGYLRTVFGSGDRQHLRDQSVGNCGYGNLKACVQSQCDVVVKEALTLGSDTLNASYTYHAGQRTSESYTLAGTNADDCSALTEDAPIVNISNCPGGGGYQDAGQYSGFDCSNDGANGFGWILDGGGCNEIRGYGSDYTNTYNPPGLSTGTYPLRNRFVSLRTFDTARPAFTTSAGATTYDNNRLEDYGTNPLAVIDVNNYTYGDGGGVLESSPGWVLPYPVYDERGSGNPVVIDDCVFWNTVQGGVYCVHDSDCCPNLADGGADATCASATCNTTTNECNSTSVCSALGSSSQFSYTANIVSGSAGCGLAFNTALSDGGTSQIRRVACTQNCGDIPPPPPTPVVVIDANGMVRNIAVGVTGSSVTTIQVDQPDDPVKRLYQVLTPENGHECRHVDGGVCY